MVIPALCSLEADCTVSCEDDSHKEKLSSCYTALTKAITSSGSNSFQHKQIRKKHPGLVPGWNEAVRVRHGIARRAFLRWRACGSPKDGRVALHMRYARLSFKYAVRKCKRERDMINVNRLAVSMLNQDNNRFWVLVKQQLGGGTPVPPSFGNISGSCNIANMWADHFKDIFNDSRCDSDSETLNHLTSGPSFDVPPIITNDVFEAVAKLKSAGCRLAPYVW